MKTNDPEMRDGTARRKDWIVSVEDKWKFTHIRAMKTERRPREDFELRF